MVVYLIILGGQIIHYLSINLWCPRPQLPDNYSHILRRCNAECMYFNAFIVGNLALFMLPWKTWPSPRVDVGLWFTPEYTLLQVEYMTETYSVVSAVSSGEQYTELHFLISLFLWLGGLHNLKLLAKPPCIYDIFILNCLSRPQ